MNLFRCPGCDEWADEGAVAGDECEYCDSHIIAVSYLPVTTLTELAEELREKARHAEKERQPAFTHDPENDHTDGFWIGKERAYYEAASMLEGERKDDEAS